MIPCVVILVQVLVSGYWPSYNVAFFPEIYEACGYPNFIDKQQKRGHEYEVPTKWLMYQVRCGNSNLTVGQAACKGCDSIAFETANVLQT